MRHSYYVKQRETSFQSGSLLLEDVFINRDDTFKGGGDVTHLAVHGGCCSAGKKRAHSSHFVHPKKTYIFVSSSHITLLMNLCPTTTTVVQGIQPDSDAKVEKQGHIRFWGKSSHFSSNGIGSNQCFLSFFLFLSKIKLLIRRQKTLTLALVFLLFKMSNVALYRLAVHAVISPEMNTGQWKRLFCWYLLLTRVSDSDRSLRGLLFVDIRLYFFYLTSHLCSSLRLKVSQS